MFFSWSIMFADGCVVSSAALMTSTGDGELASVRSVRRVPSTTMSSLGSAEAAVPADADASCAASACGRVVVAAVVVATGSAACAVPAASSANAIAPADVVCLII
jgi:hypothetical protein